MLIKVRDSKIHGRGIFAIKDIPKKTKIVEYKGKKITKKQADKIYEKSVESAEKNNNSITTYLFELNKKYDLDGNIKDNIAKYINHSCNPNCEVVNEDDHIWIYSIKDIKKDEEISFDYGFPLEDYKDHVCKCGSKNCIGYIVKKKYRKWIKKE